MTGSDTLPEPDCAPGAPHPRFATELIGQDEAEAEFLEAFNAGRLHHAWLVTGPQGVGKATLSWRIAQFLLSQPVAPSDGTGLFGESEPKAAASLGTDPDTPLARRMLALSEPRLFLLRRTEAETGGRLSADIRVGDVRALGAFLSLSATDGGRRVVIVDTVDEMNVSAANALLKMLEEPPDDVVMLLVSHQPARLLPTIRSRCRTLRLGRLTPKALARVLSELEGASLDDPAALAELSNGSAGTAIRLSETDGVALYADLLGLVDSGDRADRANAVALSDRLGARNATDRQDVFFLLVEILLSRLARTGAGHPPALDAARNERNVLSRLAPDARAGRLWARVQSDLSQRIGHGRAVNLDPAALILDTILTLIETAGQTMARA